MESASLGFLLFDVFTDDVLVPTYRGHKIASGPKMLASEVLLSSEEGSGDVDGALSFDVANHLCNPTNPRTILPQGELCASSMRKPFLSVNFERFTEGRLSHTPANVKLWESPGKAGITQGQLNLYYFLGM